jgi:hypothetical protein
MPSSLLKNLEIEVLLSLEGQCFWCARSFEAVDLRKLAAQVIALQQLSKNSATRTTLRPLYVSASGVRDAPASSRATISSTGERPRSNRQIFKIVSATKGMGSRKEKR